VLVELVSLLEAINIAKIIINKNANHFIRAVALDNFLYHRIPNITTNAQPKNMPTAIKSIHKSVNEPQYRNIAESWLINGAVNNPRITFIIWYDNEKGMYTYCKKPTNNPVNFPNVLLVYTYAAPF
jgi:hypothetical protein